MCHSEHHIGFEMSTLSHSFQYGCACFTCSSRWLPLIHIAWIHVKYLWRCYRIVNRMSTYVKTGIWRWGATHLWAALHITLHLISSVIDVTHHAPFVSVSNTQTQQSCLASTKHGINTTWCIETIVNSFLVVYLLLSFLAILPPTYCFLAVYCLLHTASYILLPSYTAS